MEKNQIQTNVQLIYLEGMVELTLFHFRDYSTTLAMISAVGDTKNVIGFPFSQTCSKSIDH